MSRKAKMVLDKEFQIAPIDKRIYGCLLYTSERCLFTKKLRFAVSHPGIGAVCTIGIRFTNASVEVSPPGLVKITSQASI